jgi:ApaG protein
MPTPVISDTTTHGIRVGATASFSAEDSDISARNHVFKYTIIIKNDGEAPAKLVSRHWIIIDGNGRREEVNGPGVVGETPRLEPGESFRYQSFCPLKTAWGTMEGSYTMKRDDGETFDVNIQRFYLRMP